MNRALPALALAALLIVTMQPATVMGQATVPQAELVVEDLRILGTPGWVDNSPLDDELHLEVDLRNQGDRDSTGFVIRYAWVDAQGVVTHLNGAEESSLNTGEPLRAGIQRTETADWNLQPEQRGAGAIRITISHDGRTTYKDHPLFIEDRRVGFELEGRTQQIRADETRYVRLLITNEGNTDETITLQLPDKHIGDNRRLDAEWDQAQLTVPAGTQHTSTLFVDYPFEGDTSPFSAVFTTRILTTFNDPVELQTPPITPSTDAYLTGYQFTAQRTGDGTIFAEPSETRTLELWLHNVAQTSNGRLSDTYRITTDASSGWEATLDAPRVALNEQESKSITIHLTAPQNAAPGTPATLALEVLSEHDDPTEPAFPARLAVPLRISGPAVTVTKIEPESSPVYRLDTPRVLVQLRNDGNQPAPSGTLQVAATESIFTHGQTKALVGSIGPGRTSLIRVDLGRILFSGAMDLEAEWRPESGHPNVHPAWAKEPLFVHEPDFTLTAAQGTTGVPGADVRYAAPPHAFTIENTGNAAETLELTATTTTGGTARLLGEATIHLEPGEIRTIPIAHTLPSPTGDLLPRTVQVHATIQDRPAQSWSASTETRVTDPQGPTFQDPTTPEEWDLTTLFGIQTTILDETAVASATVTLTDPNGANTTYELAKLRTPDAAPNTWRASHRFGSPGDHAITFQATDLAGNKATLPAQTIQVGTVAPPVLQLDTEAQQPLGWNGTLLLTITDTREVRDVLAFVTDANNTSNTRSFPVQNGQARIDFSRFAAVEPGTVTLHVEATNAAGASSSMEQELTLLGPEETQSNDPGAPDQDAPGLPGTILVLALLALALLGRRPAPPGPNDRLDRTPSRP